MFKLFEILNIVSERRMALFGLMIYYSRCHFEYQEDLYISQSLEEVWTKQANISLYLETFLRAPEGWTLTFIPSCRWPYTGLGFDLVLDASLVTSETPVPLHVFLFCDP